MFFLQGMAGGPVDPREILKGVEALLGKDGELRSLEGVPKVFSLMKASTKMVSRCMYLNILLQTKSHDVLNRFIRVGGYKLLNAWLTYSKTTNNSPLLQHKKKKKEETKVPVRDMKEKGGEEEKKDKPKAHAPSHAKIRSIGLEIGDPPNPAPPKKTPAAPQLGSKYNIKPPVLKRHSSGSGDAPPQEKKYKPLNTPSNSAKEIKVKIIPAQPMECTGFLDALNSAPVPGIKIKKKKPSANITASTKVVSPTTNKASPFDSKPVYSASSTKPASPESAASSTPADENQEPEQPGTPVPSEDPEPSDNGEKPNALAEPRGEEESLTKKGKKKKTVHWAEEEQLKHYFYFDLDETERVNVNKIKDFGEAAKRELMMDRQTFEMARRLSHDTMEERVPWTPPRPLTLAGCLVTSGANSTEKLTQRDREMGILQEIFLSKESVPDSPHEPDPEPYEPMPPRLIPLDEVVNQGLLGHGPGMNSMNTMHMQMPMNGGYPPNSSPGGPRFNHPPPPHNHGPPFSGGGGPRMMGPPPGQGRGDGNYWGDDSMRGGPHRGGHFHRGGRGRGGGDPGFRGRGRGGPRGGGHNNMNDMSKRPVCRHFMMKGSCRYEGSCAFYHPGVNGPPLPPKYPANNQHNQHPQHGH
ncbi:serine/threonine-protein phosphatase 1 regulatory subunit 10 [Neolamprologus brichardi]|uniref:serine/threonine-protein phosphatase 1 regulatory subunit 10 n=1 Tax=Neolamprologus brichardi TaxID=32507 RepID=UPI0003EC0C89|nr:serine/threonine-protein phosphatase 1 regulatory subunit 10 [Neolamprologus brichardi]